MSFVSHSVTAVDTATFSGKLHVVLSVMRLLSAQSTFTHCTIIYIM